MSLTFTNNPVYTIETLQSAADKDAVCSRVCSHARPWHRTRQAATPKSVNNTFYTTTTAKNTNIYSIFINSSRKGKQNISTILLLQDVSPNWLLQSYQFYQTSQQFQ